MPTIVVQLIWLALPVSTLLISVKAKQRQPARGGNLMVAGASIITLSALGNAALHFGMLSGSFGVEMFGNYFMASNLLGALGQVLFLFGLYQFVRGVPGSAGGTDILDHFTD